MRQPIGGRDPGQAARGTGPACTSTDPAASIPTMTNPTAPSRRRTPHRTSRVVLALLALATSLSFALATPVLATEAGGGGGEPLDIATEVPNEAGAPEGAVEADIESGKVTISDNPHDQFGLVLFGLMGLAAIAMVANAVKQLRGERPAADGRIRWR